MRRALAILLVTLAAACGSDSTTNPTAVTFAGTFTLRTVNGSALPFVILQSGQNSATLMSDAITIADGGTWSESGSVKTVTNGVTSTQVGSDAGTWIRSGNNIVLHSTNSNTNAYSGTFTNTQLNLADDIPFNYVFTK